MLLVLTAAIIALVVTVRYIIHIPDKNVHGVESTDTAQEASENHPEDYGCPVLGKIQTVTRRILL